MKKINCLASLNNYLLEICFPKELLCGARKKFLFDIGGCHDFAPVVNIP